jgi:membrane protein DedA with SNARE-associated domain
MIILLQTWLHALVRIWFEWVDQWGYFGVFVLMAMESSIIPVPSEVVIPPAAFWAAQGRMSLAGVIAAGTFGSYVGSAISYWVSQWLGLPLIQRYGKRVFITPDKVQMAEAWIDRYGAVGVFFARLLPVVRHLVSIPAGILRLNYAQFSASTVVGAGLWCGVLSWFGQEVIGSHPELLQSPDAMIHVIKAKLTWFVAGVAFLGALYGVVMWFKRRSSLSVSRTPV